jgi:hypothetical protein
MLTTSVLMVLTTFVACYGLVELVRTTTRLVRRLVVIGRRQRLGLL